MTYDRSRYGLSLGLRDHHSTIVLGGQQARVTKQLLRSSLTDLGSKRRLISQGSHKCMNEVRLNTNLYSTRVSPRTGTIYMMPEAGILELSLAHLCHSYASSCSTHTMMPCHKECMTGVDR